MSLSGALSNAVSGLTATAKGTSVVSSNIANALNENYGRRDVQLGTNATASSGGVQVRDVTRNTNPVLAFQKRHALADFAGAETRAKTATELERLMGGVEGAGSLVDRLTKFETALISAASDPSSETRLRALAFSAEGLASALRQASDGVQTARTQTDTEIARAVETLNFNLATVEKLNAQIMTAKHLGHDTLSLLDQRDQRLDQISELVPIHVVERESGAVAIFTANGRTLLDGTAVSFQFDNTPIVLPHMTASNGLLSSLRVDGSNVTTMGQGGALSGGKLEALFQARDLDSVTSHATLDGIARDLAERFGNGGPDGTVGPGDPGVFTDNGALFSAANEAGLASRIALNSNLAPDQSDIWRWRAGIYAASPNDAGDATLIQALQSQISSAITPGSTALGATSRSLMHHIHDLAEETAAIRVRFASELETANISLSNIRESVAAEGVNTDQELQKLIELEKSYAANARVVQVVDDMLSKLLSI